MPFQLHLRGFKFWGFFCVKHHAFVGFGSENLISEGKAY